MSYLPEVHIRGADDTLYGVYQDWVHQNPGNHLDGEIKEDVKWQDRWRKLVCLPTQCYDVLSGRVGKKFISILSVGLDGAEARKWNAEMVIIF